MRLASHDVLNQVTGFRTGFLCPADDPGRGPFKMLHQTKDTFEKPEDFSFEEFIRPSFGVFQAEPMRVSVWFSSEVAGYIKEKIWHESQEIHKQDDGSIIFEAKVAGMDEVKFWIMSWGSHALVLEPESLRNEIRAEFEVMVEKYSEGFEEDERPQTV